MGRSSKRLPKFHNDEALRGKPKIERKEVGEIEVLRVCKGCHGNRPSVNRRQCNGR
jgi:hypothetical protein